MSIQSGCLGFQNLLSKKFSLRLLHSMYKDKISMYLEKYVNVLDEKKDSKNCKEGRGLKFTFLPCPFCE